MWAVAAVAPLALRWRAPGSLVVLMYHRVLPQDSPVRRTEQPGMYVSPETLGLHLIELKRHFELVHLDDWLRRAKSGRVLPRLACALTFDDGWRDNWQHALPVLREHGAPATIFLISTYVGTTARFWPNRLMDLLRESVSRPGSVQFPTALRIIVEPALAMAARRGELCPDDADQAVQRAKQLGEEAIRDLIRTAEQSCGTRNEARDTMNGDEIAQLAATGLVRFGCHTATHLRLGGQVASAKLEREIVVARRELQDICGQEIDLFCYPNGELSNAAVDVVRRHYLGAVTTRKGWHNASGDHHLIRRVGMHEDISDSAQSFAARISAWL